VIRAIAAVVASGCIAVPPPPLVAMHTDTAADPKGETTVMVVAGVVMQGLGGAGVGFALRIEHQQLARTAVGLELSGGYADTEKRMKAPHQEFYAFALRGYGRSQLGAHDWTCATYGLGVAVLTTGMVAVNGHAGLAVSYPNDNVTPLLHVGISHAQPLRGGSDFGDMDDHGVHASTFLYGGMSLLKQVNDSRHTTSFELAMAYSLTRSAPLFAVSAADAIRAD
jgi:hypothetical protein